ncbi:MAG: hypothetical protein ACP5H8_02730, partial [Candidatus Micrarchaeia archaeon]
VVKETSQAEKTTGIVKETSQAEKTTGTNVMENTMKTQQKTDVAELKLELENLLYNSFYNPGENIANITNLENKIIERIKNGKKTCCKDIIEIAKRNSIPFLNPKKLNEKKEEIDSRLSEMYALYNNVPNGNKRSIMKRIGIVFATLAVGIGITYGSIHVMNNYQNEIKKATEYTYEAAESIASTAKKQLEKRINRVKHNIRKWKAKIN